MDRTINSDGTMAAMKTFDYILNQIQQSCLNYRLDVSPFSAIISLKKSFAKDKSGNPIAHYPLDNEESGEAKLKLQTLEDELSSIQSNYKELLNKYNAAVESMAVMEKSLKEKDYTISSLQVSYKAATNVAEKLNSKLVETRNKFESEKELIIKEYKSEVKGWKRELGRVNKKHLKLQKKFDSLYTPSKQVNFYHDLEQDIFIQEQSQTIIDSTLCSRSFCSICACQILNYIPEYFLGEVVNAACELCKMNANLIDGDYSEDPFSSFPNDGLPSSLVSHWLYPYNVTTKSLVDIPSLRAHYVLTPNPGSSLISMEEFLAEFKVMMDEQRREMRESCKVT